MSYVDGLKGLIGESVEIYCGSSKRTVQYSDYEINERAVVRGKLKNIVGDCIVVECSFKNGETLKVHTNDIYINAWSVSGVCVPDASLSIVDMFIEESSKQPK
jgi:hypothetical protein